MLFGKGVIIASAIGSSNDDHDDGGGGGGVRPSRDHSHS